MLTRTRPAPLLLAVLLGVVLAGCRTGGAGALGGPLAPPAPALPVPAQWSQQAGQGEAFSPALWWTRFSDATLPRLVALAVRDSSSMALAAARLQQARALRDMAGANLSAYVSAGVSAQSMRPSYAATVNSYQAGIDASWEPDLYGWRHQALSAGEADLLAQRLTLDDTRISVSAEVALAYMELRGVQLRQTVARDSQIRLQLLLELAAAGSQLDRERARTALAWSGADLSQLALGRARLEHSLALLCGVAPQALALELGLAQGKPVPQAPPGLALSLPADTLRQRPDVRAAGMRVQAALARLGQADAARKPVLHLDGSIGLHGLGVGGAGGVLRGLLGSVSGIAFDGGAGRAQVAAGQGSVLESYAVYRATVLAALGEVEDALAAIAAARARQQALNQAVEAARGAAHLAWQAYQAGGPDIQAALETQAMLLRSEDAQAQGAVAESAAYVRLYKALGGGWQPEPEP